MEGCWCALVQHYAVLFWGFLQPTSEARYLVRPSQTRGNSRTLNAPAEVRFSHTVNVHEGHREEMLLQPESLDFEFQHGHEIRVGLCLNL